MAEGKAGPRSPGVPDGWESDSSPDDYRNYSSSGRGATTADHPKGAAPGGNTGAGSRTDDAGTPGAAGRDVPERPREGWGGPGENYPPTQGPLGERTRRRDGEG